MENIIVSIVVPVYNVESYLDKCIDSIINQSFDKYELILIDDGSTDNSGRICDVWESKDSRIRVVHKTNGGLSDARNVGIDLASGKYITFIDSDDFILPNFLGYLVNLIEANNADISVCQLINVDEKGNYISKGGKSVDTVIQGNYNCMASYLRDTAIDTVAWRKLYRLSLFDSGIRYPVGKYHEDVWTTYKIISECNRIAIGSESLYAYRKREGSIVNSSFNPKRMDAVDGAIEKSKFIHSNYPALTIHANASIIYAANVFSLNMAKSSYKCYSPYIKKLQPIYRQYTVDFLRTKVRLTSKLFALFAYCNLCMLVKFIRKICYII